MTLLDLDDAPFLVRGRSLYPWSFGGYGPPVPKPPHGEARLLTPPSVVNTLAAGYVAAVHPSVSTR
jgi:hypothetical protein